MSERSHRISRGRLPRAFSLLELILVLALAIVLLGSYIAAMDEIEALDEMIRDGAQPRMVRAVHAAVVPANDDGAAAILSQDPGKGGLQTGEIPDPGSDDPSAIATPANE